jgi:hypothetical protein
MNDRFNFGEFDPVDAEDNATRERRLKQYSPEALIVAAGVEEVFVLFPGFCVCLDASDRAFQLSRVLKTPQGILILGEPGTSKTTVARYFIASLPQSDLFEKDYGALYIRLRAAPTTQQVVTALLRALKYPFINVKRNNVHTMRDIAFESIRQRGTRLVFVDQAHCLSYSSGNVRRDVNETTVSDLLVEMMDETSTSLCLLADAQFQGLEHVDRALADRVTIREKLSHFGNDEFWTGFLNSFAKQTKAIDLGCLSDPEIRTQTYTATLGNRRRFRRLIVEAALVAADAKATVVTREHLALAFRRVTGTGNECSNPYAG